jgi:hypothetical protein
MKRCGIFLGISLKNKENKLFLKRKNSVMRGLTFVILVLVGLHGFTQDKIPVKFGTVTQADFILASGPDSSADAVVVADVGNLNFSVDYTLKAAPQYWSRQVGWVTELHRSKRIYIRNKNGFAAATVYIPLLSAAVGARQDEVKELKAVTYTLENGRVVATPLDSRSVFKEKVSPGLWMEKFTFPALKEGAILEYSYTHTSPFFFNLQPWEFQGIYPCLWSEFQVEIPNYFNYVTLAQEEIPFRINTDDIKLVHFDDYMVYNDALRRQVPVNIQTDVRVHRWVVDHVPALKEEPFTTTIRNYVARIEFQIASISPPGYTPVNAMETWSGISENLLANPSFGEDLNRNNGWLTDELQTITAGAVTDLEKAQKIYAFVRDHFTCSNNSGSIMSKSSLKAVYGDKNGNTADLNLLLTAMLIHEKIAADPVILGTRSSGFTNKVYPQLSRYNYLICRAILGSSAYYLDASDPNIRFGQLPVQCYNGDGQVISKDLPALVTLSADSVVEKKTTTVMVDNGDKGGLDFGIQCYPGIAESAEIRKSIRAHGQKDFVEKLKAKALADASISDLEIDSLGLPDEPLGITYNCHLAFDSTAGLFYFNPSLLADRIGENPFKAAERLYPVEMPYTKDENVVVTMAIPNGYVVDELPKSTKVLLNTDGGYFEYIVSEDDQTIHFRSRLRLTKANFNPEDYAVLRNFYAAVVNLQNESIVFKRKK